MIKRWRHIGEIGGDPGCCLYGILFIKPFLRIQYRKSQKKLSELALYISTKLNMMPRIIESINKQCNALWNIIKERV